MNYSDLTLTADMLLNKTIVLFGSSGSGKTVFMKHILYTLSDVIDNIIVVSQTEYSNGAYDGIVPKACMHTHLTVELLEIISERQKALSKAYKTSNKYENIMDLYTKLPKNDKIIEAVSETDDFKEKRIKEINRSKKDSDIKLTEIKEVEKQVEELKKQIYKKYILYNENYLLKNNLNAEEKKNLKYLGATPHFILVLDDCASMFKKFTKNKTFLELFYQGRHLNMTVLVSCQDDTDLTPSFRKNIYVNIFTAAVTARSYIDRCKFTKSLKNSILNSLQNVFIKNQKLVYFRESSPDKAFYTCTARMHPDLRFGSPQLYELVDIVGTDEDVNKSEFDGLFN